MHDVHSYKYIRVRACGTHACVRAWVACCVRTHAHIMPMQPSRGFLDALQPPDLNLKNRCSAKLKTAHFSVAQTGDSYTRTQLRRVGGALGFILSLLWISLDVKIDFEKLDSFVFALHVLVDIFWII